MKSSYQPETCPNCGSNNTAIIRWGFPKFTDELRRDRDAGRVILGGCVRTGDDPTHACNDCQLGFRAYVVENPLTVNVALDIARDKFPDVDPNLDNALEEDIGFLFRRVPSEVNGWREMVWVSKNDMSASEQRWKLKYDADCLQDFSPAMYMNYPSYVVCPSCGSDLTGKIVRRFYKRDEDGEWQFMKAQHNESCIRYAKTDR